MTEFVKNSRETRSLDTVTRKDVFRDPLLRKCHRHGKDNKALRAGNRVHLRMIDLDDLDNIDDDPAIYYDE